MTSSPLDSLAAQYRLRIARDAYGTRIIAGRVGSLITDYGDGRLTVLLMGTRRNGGAIAGGRSSLRVAGLSKTATPKARCRSTRRTSPRARSPSKPRASSVAE